MVWSRLDILNMFLTVNKCHEKTKSNNVFSTFLPWLSVPSPLVPKDVFFFLFLFLKKRSQIGLHMFI